MESSGMTKKEYLKKYLSGGEKKKKKKKSTQSLIIKSKIVDDDIDLKNMKPIDEDELEIYDLGEEAPQIVGIIDERPEEVRLMSEYRSTKKWKIVTDEYGIEDVKITAIDRTKADDGSPKREKEISIEITKNSERTISESPPRKTEASGPENNLDSIKRTVEKKVESDSSPHRKSKKNNYDSDASPPRRTIKVEKDDSLRNHKNDIDGTPPRKPKKKNYDSDASPPRKSHKKNYDSDPSPPRRTSKKEKTSGLSPPRRARHSDSDPSPPRRRRNNFDSPPSKSTSRRKSYSSSRHKRDKITRSPQSPSVEKSNLKKSENYGLKVNSYHSSSTKKEKKSSQVEKTLSGKKAGLQSAEEMRKEGEKLRREEKEIFEKMSDDVTGRHASAIVRNRKTGRRHDSKEEARKKREKEEKEAEKIAQYAVWGKGVKQVQDREEKIKDDLYEMSKPLARYKDDKDLEEMLKNQEREGDPMLEYIRQKKKKTEVASSRPEYEGTYLPNRYDIKPGHKWDGVDRSNGYEKKWFEEQNARKAREEEAFKWSTIDM